MGDPLVLVILLIWLVATLTVGGGGPRLTLCLLSAPFSRRSRPARVMSCTRIRSSIVLLMSKHRSFKRWNSLMVEMTDMLVAYCTLTMAGSGSDTIWGSLEELERVIATRHSSSMPAYILISGANC